MSQDKETFQAEYVRLITKHQSALYAYILSIHPNRAAAEDILQETNLVLWKRMDDLNEGASFQAWAFRIAYFQTMRYLKTRKRQSWLVFDDDMTAEIAEEAEEKQSGFEDKRQALRQCLSKLKRGDVTMLRLRYEENASLKDIGRQLDRTEGALKQVYLRIRRSLKQCIQHRLKTI